MKWKNELCSPFDKEPLSESLEESTEAARAKLRADMEEYKHKLGSAALTEIWAMGYRDLNDLQNPFMWVFANALPLFFFCSSVSFFTPALATLKIL